MQDGTMVPSQRADAFIPHLSHLCRSILLLQLPWAHIPTVSTAACLWVSGSLFAPKYPTLIKYFKHTVHRDGRTMRHKNYKKTIPQCSYLVV